MKASRRGQIRLPKAPFLRASSQENKTHGQSDMKDAAEILGEVVPKAADWGKFARLIEPGNIVHNIDGRMYRIASRVCGPNGIIAFKLADLQGRPVPTPANFCPLSPAVAKFARWLRFIVAYRADFDRYVKDIIEAHGLPVDESWNWAKWFQARVAPQLSTRNEEIRDEAIHATIIRVLVEQDALGRFEKLIERFPKKVRREPLAKQVTIYLAHIFRDYETSKTNRWIKKTYPSKEVSMEQEDEEGEGYSLLDAPEYATGAEAYEAVDTDMDVARFREGFAAWLAEAPIEALHEAVLHRSARLDRVPLKALFIGPLVDGATHELGSIVAADLPRQSAPRFQLLQHAHHAPATERGVHLDRQAFARVVVHDV